MLHTVTLTLTTNATLCLALAATEDVCGISRGSYTLELRVAHPALYKPQVKLAAKHSCVCCEHCLVLNVRSWSMTCGDF